VARVWACLQRSLADRRKFASPGIRASMHPFHASRRPHRRPAAIVTPTVERRFSLQPDFRSPLVAYTSTTSQIIRHHPAPGARAGRLILVHRCQGFLHWGESKAFGGVEIDREVGCLYLCAGLDPTERSGWGFDWAPTTRSCAHVLYPAAASALRRGRPTTRDRAFVAAVQAPPGTVAFGRIASQRPRNPTSRAQLPKLCNDDYQAPAAWPAWCWRLPRAADGR